MKTWIAVLNRTEARFFETTQLDGKDFKLVTKLENPRGRLRSGDINADRPGASPSDGHAYPSGYTNHEDPVERVAHMFALSISDYLDKGRNDHLYDDLVLVGEPHFLGKMKAALTKQTFNTVTRTLTKDLVNIPDHQVHEYVFQ
jgi:protein required for attachment to host cells